MQDIVTKGFGNVSDAMIDGLAINSRRLFFNECYFKSICKIKFSYKNTFGYGIEIMIYIMYW